jgi:C-terminal domain on Strawberry notch homologue/P-loop containing NTP hydrolase pore-1
MGQTESSLPTNIAHDAPLEVTIPPVFNPAISNSVANESTQRAPVVQVASSSSAPSSAAAPPAPPAPPQPEIAEEEQYAPTETFQEYVPKRYVGGIPHPTRIVESKAMGAVLPPEITYKLHLPEASLNSLSNAQQETVTYVCQQFSKYLGDGARQGFLIGDGAGVGKGRQLAATIAEQWHLPAPALETPVQGGNASVLNSSSNASVIVNDRRAIWVSVSGGLVMDAARDLADIGASYIPIYSLQKLGYVPLNQLSADALSKAQTKVKSSSNAFSQMMKNQEHIRTSSVGYHSGVIFTTYSSLIARKQNYTSKLGARKNSKFPVQHKSHLEQLVEAFGVNFDGVIVFDEAHKAKNLAVESKKDDVGMTNRRLTAKQKREQLEFALASASLTEEEIEQLNSQLSIDVDEYFSPDSPFYQVASRNCGVLDIGKDELEKERTSEAVKKVKALKKVNKGSKTAAVAVLLQRLLPNAKVVYASATGASSPRHMGIFSRLGLWGSIVKDKTFLNIDAMNQVNQMLEAVQKGEKLFPFSSFGEFVKVVEAGGTSALEICAVNMKSMGIYCARSLSYLDATFETEALHVSKEFKDMYDDGVHKWGIVYRLLQSAFKQAFQMSKIQVEKVDHARLVRPPSPMKDGKVVKVVPPNVKVEYKDHKNKTKSVPLWFVSALRHFNMRCAIKNEAGEVTKKYWSQIKGYFFGSTLRWGGQMVLASKVPGIADIAKRAIEAGNAVVIGMQSTGEAVTRTRDENDDMAEQDARFEREEYDDEFDDDAMDEFSDELDDDDDEDDEKLDFSQSSPESSFKDRFKTETQTPGLVSAPKQILLRVIERRFPLPPVPIALLKKYGQEHLIPPTYNLFEEIVEEEWAKMNAARKTGRSDTANEEEVDEETAKEYFREELSKSFEGDELFDQEEEDQYVKDYTTLACMRYRMLEIIENMRLPPNPLDYLIYLLGGSGKVAEMTGRKSQRELVLPLAHSLNPNSHHPTQIPTLVSTPQEQAPLIGVTPTLVDIKPDINAPVNAISNEGNSIVIDLSSGSDSDDIEIVNVQANRATSSNAISPRAMAISDTHRSTAAASSAALASASRAPILETPMYTLEQYCPTIASFPPGAKFLPKPRGTSIETTNLREREAFQTGQKIIAIISEAASAGISLHSDRNAKNKRRRVHITLELSWSPFSMVQQFGRSFRANQVSAPHYVLAMCDIAGEMRFASAIASRLEQLGALTRGDRRVKSSNDFSGFSFDTPAGAEALRSIVYSVLDSSMTPKVNNLDFLQSIGKIVTVNDNYLLEKQAVEDDFVGGDAQPAFQTTRSINNEAVADTPIYVTAIAEGLESRFTSIDHFLQCCRGWFLDIVLARFKDEERMDPRDKYIINPPKIPENTSVNPVVTLHGDAEAPIAVVDAPLSYDLVASMNPIPPWWDIREWKPPSPTLLNPLVILRRAYISPDSEKRYQKAMQAYRQEVERQASVRVKEDFSSTSLNQLHQILSENRIRHVPKLHTSPLEHILWMQPNTVFCKPIRFHEGVLIRDHGGNKFASKDVGRFLNRLLQLPLSTQAALFGWFNACFEVIVKEMRSAGKLENGLVSVRANPVSALSSIEDSIDENDEEMKKKMEEFLLAQGPQEVHTEIITIHSLLGDLQSSASVYRQFRLNVGMTFHEAIFLYLALRPNTPAELLRKVKMSAIASREKAIAQSRQAIPMLSRNDENDIVVDDDLVEDDEDDRLSIGSLADFIAPDDPIESDREDEDEDDDLAISNNNNRRSMEDAASFSDSFLINDILESHGVVKWPASLHNRIYKLWFAGSFDNPLNVTEAAKLKILTNLARFFCETTKILDVNSLWKRDDDSDEIPANIMEAVLKKIVKKQKKALTANQKAALERRALKKKIELARKKRDLVRAAQQDIPELPLDDINPLLAIDKRFPALGFYRPHNLSEVSSTREYDNAIILVVPQNLKAGAAEANADDDAKILALGKTAQEESLRVLLTVYRPESGLTFLSGDRAITPSKLHFDYRRVINIRTILKDWSARYEQSGTHCKHGKLECCVNGRREQVIHLITGSILPIWSELDRAIQKIRKDAIEAKNRASQKERYVDCYDLLLPLRCCMIVCLIIFTSCYFCFLQRFKRS